MHAYNKIDRAGVGCGGDQLIDGSGSKWYWGHEGVSECLLRKGDAEEDFCLFRLKKESGGQA